MTITDTIPDMLSDEEESLALASGLRKAHQSGSLPARQPAVDTICPYGPQWLNGIRLNSELHATIEMADSSLVQF